MRFLSCLSGHPVVFLACSVCSDSGVKRPLVSSVCLRVKVCCLTALC